MMKSSKALSVTIILVLCVSLFAACMSFSALAEPADGDKPLEGKRIGVSLWYKGDEWCVGIDEAFKKLGAELGATMIVQDPNGVPEAQQNHLENFATQNVDMIAFDAVDPDGVGITLDAIAAKGIPIIGFDELPHWDGLVSAISWDNYATGVEMGKYVRNYIDDKNDGKGSIVILTFTQSPLTVTRVDGFMVGLGELNDNIKIVAIQDPEQIEEKAHNMITNIKEPFDIVFATADPSAFGAVTALEAMNAQNVKVFSCGGYGEKSLSMFTDGNPYYEAVIVVPPYDVVKAVMDVMVDYFTGKADQIPEVVNSMFYIADHSDYSSLLP